MKELRIKDPKTGHTYIKINRPIMIETQNGGQCYLVCDDNETVKFVSKEELDKYYKGGQ